MISQNHIRLAKILTSLSAKAQFASGVCCLHLATTISLVQKMLIEHANSKLIDQKLSILESDLEDLLLL
jgi:hypothetical protein